jgi:hypothetical protein
MFISYAADFRAWKVIRDTEYYIIIRESLPSRKYSKLSMYVLNNRASEHTRQTLRETPGERCEFTS